MERSRITFPFRMEWLWRHENQNISILRKIIQTVFWSRIKACEKLLNAPRGEQESKPQICTHITRLRTRDTEIRTSSNLNYPFWFKPRNREKRKKKKLLWESIFRSTTKRFSYISSATNQTDQSKTSNTRLTPDHNFKRTKSQPVPQIYESKQSII